MQFWELIYLVLYPILSISGLVLSLQNSFISPYQQEYRVATVLAGILIVLNLLIFLNIDVRSRTSRMTLWVIHYLFISPLFITWVWMLGYYGNDVAISAYYFIFYLLLPLAYFSIFLTGKTLHIYLFDDDKET